MLLIVFFSFYVQTSEQVLKVSVYYIKIWQNKMRLVLVHFYQKIFRNLRIMSQFARKTPSMEVIPQQSSRLCSQQHIKDPNSDSPSFDLLIRAYDRIRALEQQNEQLHSYFNQLEQRQKTLSSLHSEIQRLNQVLREKDIRIQNLQKISQKAIMEYVKIQRELQLLNVGACRIRRNLTAQTSEPSTPFHTNINNHHDQQEEGNVYEHNNRNLQREEHKEHFRQQKLQFKRHQQKDQNIYQQFTFDCRPRSPHSPNAAKLIKNCFSTAEMTKLVNKVHTRHDSNMKSQNNKIQQYRSYCSSMQKKYTPPSPMKKCTVQMIKYPLAIKRSCNSPKVFKFRNSTPFGEKNWDSSMTTASRTGASFGMPRDSHENQQFY